MISQQELQEEILRAVNDLKEHHGDSLFDGIFEADEGVEHFSEISTQNDENG